MPNFKTFFSLLEKTVYMLNRIYAQSNFFFASGGLNQHTLYNDFQNFAPATQKTYMCPTVYMPSQIKISPSAKTVYMPVRIYAQPSGKFFAFGEKAIKKQHKTMICDQKFQKIFAFGENRIYAQPYI